MATRLTISEGADADPDREAWCAEQFANVLKNPPPHPQFHVATSNYHWDNFAAMLIPQMLAENPTHEGVRTLCADFALAFNYSVSQDLMKFAFEQRGSLGDDFRRLQRPILLSSGMRNVKTVMHGGNSFWDCPNIEYDIGSRFNELIEQFAKTGSRSKKPSLLMAAISGLIRRAKQFFGREASHQLPHCPASLPDLCEIAERPTTKIVDIVRQQHATTTVLRSSFALMGHYPARVNVPIFARFPVD